MGKENAQRGRKRVPIVAPDDGDERDAAEDDPLAPKLNAQLSLYREKLSCAYSPGVGHTNPERPTRHAFYMRTIERYAAQLPCLHAGLRPRDAAQYPALAAWWVCVATRPGALHT